MEALAKRAAVMQGGFLARTERPPALWFAGLMLLATLGIGLGWFGTGFFSVESRESLGVQEPPAVVASNNAVPGPTVVPTAAPLKTAPDAPLPVAAKEPTSVPLLKAEDRSDGPIFAALVRWRRALLSNDAAQIAPLYAAKVDRYFQVTHVDRSFVSRYMQVEQARGSKLEAYSFRGLKLDRNPDGTVGVHFVTNYKVDTPSGVLSGATRTELEMREEDGEWKIFSERDFSS